MVNAYVGEARGCAATTTNGISVSTMDVHGSSTRKMALWTPARGWAHTVISTGLFKGSSTRLGARKVPSLPTQRNTCATGWAGPLVRVTRTV